MTRSLAIQPLTQAPGTTVRPPGSKSLTNRALICAALAAGDSTLTGALASDDTRVMLDGLKALGVAIEADAAQTVLRVHGTSGKIPAKSADIFVGNSGTTVRFLTALVALGHGRYRLHGTPRMHERPIQDLLDALSPLGVDAKSEENNGCPPVVVNAGGLSLREATIRGDTSSQFLSALLMVAPCAAPADGAKVKIEGPLVSLPYVTMTARVMQAFGGRIQHDDACTQFEIAGGGYRGVDFQVEPDASAASYFWAAAAVCGGQVRVSGINRKSTQGDVAFVDCLAKMGCEVRDSDDGITVIGRPLRGIEVDMNAISDTVPTLAVVALFATGPTTIKGVAHIRHKETDRIAAVATELRKLGATVEEFADGLRITPGPLQRASIDTYDDHRMAMSFAIAGLKIPGVVINDPDCTAKTYPGFFEDLERLRR